MNQTSSRNNKPGLCLVPCPRGVTKHDIQWLCVSFDKDCSMQDDRKRENLKFPSYTNTSVSNKTQTVPAFVSQLVSALPVVCEWMPCMLLFVTSLSVIADFNIHYNHKKRQLYWFGQGKAIQISVKYFKFYYTH